MARKNLAKYLFDEKNGKTYLEYICSVSEKSYFELFGPALHTEVHIFQTRRSLFFAQNFANI